MDPDSARWAADVARTFGLGVPRGPAVAAARGQQGLVRRLETDRGVWAVKELHLPLQEAEAVADADFATTMAGRGVLAPVPVRTADRGTVVADVGGVRVRVATWLDIAGPSRTLDPVALGTLFATLHRDPVDPGGEVDPWFTDPVTPQEWAEVSDALAAAGAPFAPEFARTVPRLTALAALFRPPRDVQRCHRDLWADNVRATPSGRLAVIDWDNCGPAEATGEVCVGLVEFCRRDPATPRAFLAAYRRAGGPGRPREREDFTFVLAQFGHFAHLAGRRWLEAATDDERTRARDWFHEEYDDPLGVEEIDALLAAVRD